MGLYFRVINVLAMLGMFSFSAQAIEPVYSDFFGKAIKGYDPVAYFTQSKAVKGPGQDHERFSDDLNANLIY